MKFGDRLIVRSSVPQDARRGGRIDMTVDRLLQYAFEFAGVQERMRSALCLDVDLVHVRPQRAAYRGNAFNRIAPCAGVGQLEGAGPMQANGLAGCGARSLVAVRLEMQSRVAVLVDQAAAVLCSANVPRPRGLLLDFAAQNTPPT